MKGNCPPEDSKPPTTKPLGKDTNTATIPPITPLTKLVASPTRDEGGTTIGIGIWIGKPYAGARVGTEKRFLSRIPIAFHGLVGMKLPKPKRLRFKIVES